MRILLWIPERGMTSQPPAVSVIVPVYNVESHIHACIASLRAQRFADFEVIVVDDGSTDSSYARARAAIGEDPRFCILRQANGGLSAARNTGLTAARGDLIAFVDSDDQVTPDWLEQMTAALEQTGADWVSCAIAFVAPDGSQTTHSGLHGAPELTQDTAPQLYDLTDWGDVIRHFPSAWNKLYRRSLIDGLEFPVGTWFEDHGFYYRAAARTQQIAHVPHPLYLQTQGREGQITRADSDRVFEQFAVLDDIAAQMARPGKTGAQTAFERIAGRLLYERSTALHAPDRRARFARAARDYLDRHGLRYDTGWDAALSPAWGLEMDGALPLSIVIPWDGVPELLAASLHSIAVQDALPGCEVIISCDRVAQAEARTVCAAQTGLGAVRILTSPQPGAGAARNAGLAAATGLLVVFLDAGDRLMPAALGHWSAEMIRHSADLGLSMFRMGPEDRHVHSGFHDLRGPAFAPARDAAEGLWDLPPEAALALHCHPSAKIFRRAFLNATGTAFGTGPLADWQIGIPAALRSTQTLYFAWPGVEIDETPIARRLWTSPVPARALAAAIAGLGDRLPTDTAARLQPGWQRRLLARAIWEKASFAQMGRAQKLGFVVAAALALLRLPALPPAPAQGDDMALDPYLGARLRRLARLGRSAGSRSRP